MDTRTTRKIPFDRLSAIMPVSGPHGFVLTGRQAEVFQSNMDRTQFIYNVLSVLSHNGDETIPDYDFKFLYLRADLARGMIATLVATEKGVIIGKLMPKSGGHDKIDAFRAFQRFIDAKLCEILQDVPDLDDVDCGSEDDEDDDDEAETASDVAQKPSSVFPPAYEGNSAPSVMTAARYWYCPEKNPAAIVKPVFESYMNAQGIC